eukprot:CAMPEP_0119104972 /NCGR_PEP_ID=MMETSP1180-20130426/3048_1 /TAXON_ID=3052 ORGANISM="Chlamydomonas cf sp, Strain CCMP681" /NCGR_SAMPLE_ID=MMETSP1180 /ASSEMBLY_ACC=CAM_ASM_000741 /LENGTH=282 /DNA_ID=CAMNT_0007089877 /DNA_START=245 /DNA_END=1093 /DNA_ORIENTATION=+
MSAAGVVASPASAAAARSSKRLLDGTEEDLGFSGSPTSQHAHAQYKRARLHLSPAYGTAGRCGPYATSSHPQSSLVTLLALFPGMDEKVVQGVLHECGHSLDAAIRLLTDLRLTPEEATAAAAAEAAGVAAQPSSNGASPAPADAEPTTTAGPQTAEQWIDFLVSEMLASRDMGDARTRAASVLQHFEQFFKQQAAHESDSRVAELLKENSIFKKAVQIQNARMQAKQGMEEELQQLRHTVTQYQEQLRKLEVHNYSLALHLQQATNSSGSGMAFPRNPDVF